MVHRTSPGRCHSASEQQEEEVMGGGKKGFQQRFPTSREMWQLRQQHRLLPSPVAHAFASEQILLRSRSDIV